MLAAVAAADRGAHVLLLEKNEKTGKKLYITGKGRCNLTNDCDEADFLHNVVSNPKFLHGAIHRFNPAAAVDFFARYGLELKTERGQRVFPVSDKASDVIAAFNRALSAAGATVALNCAVSEVKRGGGGGDGGGFTLRCRNGRQYAARRLILACGGVSYPATGSTGDGFQFAAALGHKVVQPRPALVSIIVKDAFVRQLEGLSLRNIGFSIKNEADKVIFSDFGEMLFTENGVGGPLALTASSRINRMNLSGVYITLDLKPALRSDQLDDRILRDFSELPNKQFKNSLDALLPQSLIPVAVARSGISADKTVNQISRFERMRLVALLKDFRMQLRGLGKIEEGIVTSGGVDVRNVDPRTMESKIVSGLYFAGEMLDVDALTGGYNIQAAMSTGYLAGQSAAGSLL
jgi:predicted Rossmann fold flavoprotein